MEKGKGSEEYQLYMHRFEKWMKNYLENETATSPEWENDPYLYGNYSSANSICEIALGIHNALRGQDLSLDQLSVYIGQIGNIISQADIRGIANQSRSMYNQMLSVVFDKVESTNVLLECHKEDSYAYLYLLIRLLYEILLYTKSTAVRGFAFYQIVRNANVLKYLFGLVYRQASKPATALDVSEDVLIESTGDDASLDPNLDPMNSIGFPASNYTFGAFDNIFLQILQSDDLNLRLCGLQLMATSPSIVANNPQLLNEMKLNLVGVDDECSYVSAISLCDILCLVPKVVAIQFLEAAYSRAVEFTENPQRIQSFVAVALGCGRLNFLEVSRMGYRMCWNLWFVLDGFLKKCNNLAASAIIAESQFHLLVASTLICFKFHSLETHQRCRLESLIYEQDDREVTDLAFCLNILYSKDPVSRSSVDASLRLLSVTGIDEENKDLVASLNLHSIKHQFFLFKDCGDVDLFKGALDLLPTLLENGPKNLNIIFAVKSAFLDLETNQTAYLIRILEIIQPFFDKVSRDLKLKVILAISTICRCSYIRDFERFRASVNELHTKIIDENLKFSLRVGLAPKDFCISPLRISRIKSTLFVRMLYDIVSERSKVCKIKKTAYTYIDLVSDKVYNSPVGDCHIQVVMFETEDGLTRDILQGVKSIIADQTANIDRGIDLYNIMQLCMRMGFYTKAAEYCKHFSLWTDETLLWFNALFHYAKAESEVSDIRKSVLHRRQCLDSLEAHCDRNHVEIAQKLNYELWQTRLNYYTCDPMLKTWCTLKLVFQVAIGHMKYKLANDDGRKLSEIFIGLKMHFKVLKWLFQKICHETVSILSIYESLAVVLHLLCRSFYGGEKSAEDYRDVENIFKEYLFDIDSTLQLPDTSIIFSMLPRRLLIHLATVKCFLHEETDCDSGKNFKDFSVTTLDEDPVKIRDLWEDLAVYRKVNVKDKVFMYKRDFPFIETFGDIISRIEDSGKGSLLEFLNEVSGCQLPTPIGFIKAFPLPFAAITATIFMQKRGDNAVQAVRFEGSIRNRRKNTEYHFVKIRMESQSEEWEFVYQECCKLIENTLNHTTLINLSGEECKNVRFIALPLDEKFIPRGPPSPVHIIQKEQ